MSFYTVIKHLNSIWKSPKKLVSSVVVVRNDVFKNKIDKFYKIDKIDKIIV